MKVITITSTIAKTVKSDLNQLTKRLHDSIRCGAEIHDDEAQECAEHYISKNGHSRTSYRKHNLATAAFEAGNLPALKTLLANGHPRPMTAGNQTLSHWILQACADPYEKNGKRTPYPLEFLTLIPREWITASNLGIDCFGSNAPAVIRELDRLHPGLWREIGGEFLARIAHYTQCLNINGEEYNQAFSAVLEIIGDGVEIFETDWKQGKRNFLLGLREDEAKSKEYALASGFKEEFWDMAAAGTTKLNLSKI